MRSTEVTLRWDAPDDPYSDIEMYEVRYFMKGAEHNASSVLINRPESAFSNLRQTTVYGFQVMPPPQSLPFRPNRRPLSLRETPKDRVRLSMTKTVARQWLNFRCAPKRRTAGASSVCPSSRPPAPFSVTPTTFVPLVKPTNDSMTTTISLQPLTSTPKRTCRCASSPVPSSPVSSWWPSSPSSPSSTCAGIDLYRFYGIFTGFYRVLPRFTGFYRVFFIVQGQRRVQQEAAERLRHARVPQR